MVNDFLKDIIKETGNEYASLVSDGVEAGDVEEFIDTGKIKRLVDLKATPDQVEWFASLTKEQAGFIQDWWDEQGERKWATT